MSAPKSFKLPEDGHIKNCKELRQIRDSLLTQHMKYKFEISRKQKYNTDDCKEEKTGYTEKRRRSTMFDSVKSMESLIMIKGTTLEKELIEMERRLTSNDAKKHISRECKGKGCTKKAPHNYPNNIYLCDKHKETLCERLECDIVCDKGSAQDKQKCKALKEEYQQFLSSIKTPDRLQSFNNKHLYPKNYFPVAMANLLCFQQQISRIDSTAFDGTQKKTMQQLKGIGMKLMDLLISARQHLNDAWDDFCEFVINRIDQLGNIIERIAQGVAAFNEWITANAFYVFGLYTVCGAMIAGIFDFAIYGDTVQRKISGATAVGIGIGSIFGGPAGAVVGGLIGGGIGAIVWG